ncbi:MAG: hypothetical protein ACJ8B9_05840, partial [Microvirga sp.]
MAPRKGRRLDAVHALFHLHHHHLNGDDGVAHEQAEPWSGEITLRRRDGWSFPGHVSDAPVYDETGRL